MLRNFGTNSQGIRFSLPVIKAVWLKAQGDVRYPGFRRDKCRAWMKWEKYGKTEQFGWEIDHIKPVSLGGTDDLSNLQPLQWQNNRSKSNNYPQYLCKV
jgi:5-methylcytosine-specific restriction endonuclease McrA